MTLAEFNALDLDHRCEAILEWGFYISRVKTNTTNRVLYSLNGFFAEMILQIEDNKILDAVAFNKIIKDENHGYFITNDNPFIRAVA